jgi:hypothetical protein
MAAGAIPPPLFFERRRQFFSGILKDTSRKSHSVDHALRKRR